MSRPLWKSYAFARVVKDTCSFCGCSGKLLKCGHCRAACYCSRQCQRLGWNHHKLFCNRIDTFLEYIKSDRTFFVSTILMGTVHKYITMSDNPLTAVDTLRGTHLDIDTYIKSNQMQISRNLKRRRVISFYSLLFVCSCFCHFWLIKMPLVAKLMENLLP